MKQGWESIDDESTFPIKLNDEERKIFVRLGGIGESFKFYILNSSAFMSFLLDIMAVQKNLVRS